MQIDGRIKLMVACFVIIALVGFILIYGVQNTINLMQNNVLDLFIGIAIGAIIVWLLMQGTREQEYPMTAKETFSRFCRAAPEELGLPIKENQIMLALKDATLIQKGKLLAYIGRLYSSQGNNIKYTIIFNSTIRDPSRMKSSMLFKRDKVMLIKEVMDLMDKLGVPAGSEPGKEALLKTMKEAKEVSTALAKEEEG